MAATDHLIITSHKIYLVFICFNVFLLLDCSRVAVSQSIVRSLPGFDGPLPFVLETGYVGVDESDDVQFFYYFIKSERKPSEDPLVLWLSGGPRCSSFNGLAYETGPLRIKDDAKYDGGLPTLVLNPDSWTKLSNMIFLDSPVDSGFSYSKTWQGTYTGDILSSKQVVIFLRKWLLKHPEFLSNPFYVAGDSYSGMTVPLVVNNIADGNEAGLEPLISLKGYLLGNPITNLDVDSNYRIRFSHRMGLISDELYKSVKKNCNAQYVNVDPSNYLCLNELEAVSECTSRISDANILEPQCPSDKFEIALPESSRKILLSPPSINPLSKCKEYGYMLSYFWANNDRVQQALNITKGSKAEWLRCNHKDQNYTHDVTSTVPYHRILSKRNYRSLIYSGDHDLKVPYISTQAWIKSLGYLIVDEWRPWFVHSQVAGYTRTYANNMTFATVKGGGHTAPSYKPAECFAMFARWISLEQL